jgi:hypothetical protein
MTDTPMDAETRLAAYAVIELALRQSADPSRTQERRDELVVILRDVDPTMVALEIATVLVGVSVGYRVRLGSIIEQARARILAEEQ